jgi:hypothetical protein
MTLVFDSKRFIPFGLLVLMTSMIFIVVGLLPFPQPQLIA